MKSFLGTWIANLSKSQRHANHQFESATLRFDMSGDAVRLTHSGLNAKGEQESGTTMFHPDGKEYPVEQAPGVVGVAELARQRFPYNAVSTRALRRLPPRDEGYLARTGNHSRKG